MSKIWIEQGDITRAEVDVIVNAANPIMLGGGGVDGAIHRAAGPKLIQACRRVKSVNGIRCPVGECRITEAGNLNAKYIIHTVGPRFRIDEDPQKLLASSYRNSLMLAVEKACASIAFPAISCGAYGYPIFEAADIAIKQCKAAEFAALEIYFYLFGNETYKAWQHKLDEQHT